MWKLSQLDGVKGGDLSTYIFSTFREDSIKFWVKVQTHKSSEPDETRKFYVDE